MIYSEYLPSSPPPHSLCYSPTHKHIRLSADQYGRVVKRQGPNIGKNINSRHVNKDVPKMYYTLGTHFTLIQKGPFIH